jgi:hypothetical protein
MLGMLCIFGITMAQNSDEHAIYPTALPADTWNFIQYGNFDTNPYTGTVSVSIPIYTYEDPDFKFPISLHYGSNGMVPNRTPGFVGHDWSLSIGGVITRTVRGIPDDEPYNGRMEFWTTPFMLASNILILNKPLTSIDVSDVYGFTSLFPSPQNVYGFAYLHLKEKPVFNGSGEDKHFPMYVFSKSLTEPLITLYGKYENWADAIDDKYRTYVPMIIDNMASYQEPPKAMFYDTQPDLFHFNVCGYSGDFAMGLCKEVKVFNTNVPAGEISVSFENDFLDGNNSAIDPLGKDGNRIPYGGWKRIVIKVGDGTKFIFENKEHINTLPSQNLNVAESAGSRSRNAWHLSSIEAINGRKATLVYNDRVESYSKNPPLGGVRYGLDSEGYSWPEIFAGQLMPLLKNVVVDNDSTITLTYERYDNNTKTRLKSIIIKHKSKNLKTASLNYINKFNGVDLRRNFLRSVSVSGEGEYQMEYLGIDSSLVVNAPEVGTLELDHWGYYNARNRYLAELYYDSSGEEVIDERYHRSAPDSTSAKFGMLSKMKWPTGGYTTYTYEANRYDKVVVLDTIYNDKYRIGEAVRDTTNKLPSRTVGGLRIKKIANYDKSNVLTGFKEFRYNIGLLCKEPFHVAMFEMVAAPGEQLWVFNPGSPSQLMEYPLSGNIKVSGDIMSSDFNQIGQYHIVYPKVTEINADGSYTSYEYLSFLDSQLQSFNSEKRAIQSVYGEVLEPNFFAPYEMPMYYENGLYNRNARVYQKLMWKSSVNDLGFGKPKMITSYNSSNQVVCQKKFEYNLSASKNTLWYPQPPLTGPGGGGRYIGMKPSIAESPLLIKEIETLYYNGGITINKQTEYKYNDSHQLIKRIETSSSSDDVFETNYVYPLNFRVDSYSPNSGGIKTIYTYPSGSVGIMAKKMVDKNVVNKPLSNDQMVNGNQTQKIDYTYVQSGNLINLAQISQTSNDGQLVLQTNVEYYDSKGRPLQVRYPDGKVETIVWGYGGRFVAARIENKTKAQVESLIGSLQIPLVGTLDYQKEKTLRGVSDAYVTTYEYLDGVGISRITQPDGTSAFFVYNTDGKLVGAFDTNGNPVSSVNYNIQK